MQEGEQAPDFELQDSNGNTVKLNFFRGQKKDRKSTRLNSSHIQKSRMPSSA